MRIFYNSKLPELLRADGTTICNWIFIRYSKENCPAWLLEHEKVHIQQQKDRWYVGMWVLYAWDYLKGRVKGQTHYDAYMNIRFEKEAYALCSPHPTK